MFFACQDETTVEEFPLHHSVTLDEPVAYTEFHFKQLGTEIAKLASNPDFRRLVYSEVDKKFDGDNNVLLETLSSALSNSNTRIADNLSTNESFKSSLEAFKNIEGESYCPQIYIPFYAELKEASAKNSSGRILSADSDPLFVFFTGDESQEIVPSYRLDGTNGEFIETDILVDEEYALSNEVWVLSINERIENGQLVNYNENNVASDQSFARTATTLRARITRVDIKCRKESWLAGKHEIRMRAASTWYSMRNPSTGNKEAFYQIGSNALGDHMAKVRIRKRDVRRRKWKVVSMDYRFGSKWNTDYGNHLIYTIFEKDNWPAKLREASFRVPGGGTSDKVYIAYCSSDDEWVTHYVTSSQAGNHHISNSCIKVWTGWY